MIIDYLFWFYELNFCTINIHLLATGVLTIPVVLVLVIVYLAPKAQIDNIFLLWIIISLFIAFLVLNFIILPFVAVNEGVSYEDNPYRYNHIYSISGYKEFTYQFPKKLSKDLLKNDKVKFYYSPQFLQGGFNLELLLDMQIEDINNYILQYEDRVKQFIEIKEENDSNLYSKYGIYKSYHVLKDEEVKDFFSDCCVYILESASYKPYNWNHGVVSYIVKNERLNKLLLVSQVW